MFLGSCVSCIAKDKVYKVITIYKAIDIPKDENYKYSDESTLSLNGIKYSLRQKAVYDNDGRIQTLIVYKSEDKLVYTHEELLKDYMLLQYYQLPVEHNWYIQNNKLIRADDIVQVNKINNFFYKSKNIQNGESILYVVSS